MSDDPSSPPLQRILLDSPPDSPILCNVSAAAAIDPPHLFYRSPQLVIKPTPMKRPRKKNPQHPAHRLKRFRTGARGGQESQPETSDWASEASIGTLDYNGGSSRSPSPPPIPTIIPTEDDDYERYVNLVLADCLPFYQISSTVYVVQGWDRKNNEPTVRTSI